MFKRIYPLSHAKETWIDAKYIFSLQESTSDTTMIVFRDTTTLLVRGAVSSLVRELELA